ncbi:MAG TPA: MlaD family protein [Spirochaetota bacterium]|nr:MCE family protein [Spirochaetota bacterium]HQO39568.1 MlaD family protein [Spirochaetota bacterium]
MKKIAFKNPNEYKVGLFIIIPAVLLLMFVILKLGYSISGSTIDVYLKVDNISALKKGTSIKMKGYEVGRVVELTPVYKPTLHFLATLRIDSSMDLHEDCSAVIMNQNIIGDPAIELRNPDRKGAPLRNGDVIEGLEYVNLEAVLEDVHALLRTLTDTVGVVKDISIESRQNIRGLLTSLTGSVESINTVLGSSKENIIATLEAFRETAVTMKEISAELKKHPMSFIMGGKDDDKKK